VPQLPRQNKNNTGADVLLDRGDEHLRAKLEIALVTLHFAIVIALSNSEIAPSTWRTSFAVDQRRSRRRRIVFARPFVT
jgi:thiamine phosphate synthase YjbQ (UPF0047 family)